VIQATYEGLLKKYKPLHSLATGLFNTPARVTPFFTPDFQLLVLVGLLELD